MSEIAFAKHVRQLMANLLILSRRFEHCACET